MKRVRVTRKGSHLGSLFAISTALLLLSFGMPAHAAGETPDFPKRRSRQDKAPDGGNSLVGGKFQVGLPFIDGKADGGLLATGLVARVDSPTHFIEMGFGALGSAGSSLYYALYTEVGASFYLQQRSTAPYIGVGGIARFTGSYWWGGPQLLAYGQAGIALARGEKLQGFLDIRVAPSLTAIDVSHMPDDHDGPHPVRPIEVAVQFGFGW